MIFWCVSVDLVASTHRSNSLKYLFDLATLTLTYDLQNMMSSSNRGIEYLYKIWWSKSLTLFQSSSQSLQLRFLHVTFVWCWPWDLMTLTCLCHLCIILCCVLTFDCDTSSSSWDEKFQSFSHLTVVKLCTYEGRSFSISNEKSSEWISFSRNHVAIWNLTSFEVCLEK